MMKIIGESFGEEKWTFGEENNMVIDENFLFEKKRFDIKQRLPCVQIQKTDFTKWRWALDDNEENEFHDGHNSEIK